MPCFGDGMAAPCPVYGSSQWREGSGSALLCPGGAPASQTTCAALRPALLRSSWTHALSHLNRASHRTPIAPTASPGGSCARPSRAHASSRSPALKAAATAGAVEGHAGARRTATKVCHRSSYSCANGANESARARRWRAGTTADWDVDSGTLRAPRAPSRWPQGVLRLLSAQWIELCSQRLSYKHSCRANGTGWLLRDCRTTKIRSAYERDALLYKETVQRSQWRWCVRLVIVIF